jgi:hypothetical protein
VLVLQLLLYKLSQFLFNKKLLLEGYPDGFTGSHLYLKLFQLFSQLFLIANALYFSGSIACEVLTSNPRVMGMMISDGFLHFEYFSLVTGFLKPSDSFLINTKSFLVLLDVLHNFQIKLVLE